MLIVSGDWMSQWLDLCFVLQLMPLTKPNQASLRWAILLFYLQRFFYVLVLKHIGVNLYIVFKT